MRRTPLPIAAALAATALLPAAASAYGQGASTVAGGGVRVGGVRVGVKAWAAGVRVAAWVEEQHPHVDVVVYDGGQERYPLLVSVE